LYVSGSSLFDSQVGFDSSRVAFCSRSNVKKDFTQSEKRGHDTSQQVNSLKEYMPDLAELGTTFGEVTGIEGSMEKLAGLRDPMVQLAALRISLDQIARFEKPMLELAKLKLSAVFS